MDKKEKRLFISFAILIITITVMCYILYEEEARVFSVDVSQFETINEVEYRIDAVTNDGKMLYIRGWALIPGETICEALIYVALLDEENNVYYQLPTEMEIRTDVSSERGEEGIYDNCGFCSWSKLSKIGDGRYRICILYGNDGNKKLIRTDQEIKR